MTIEAATYSLQSSATVMETIMISFRPGTVIFGTPGDDRLEGTFFADTLLGNGGDDTLIGLGAGDFLNGGQGTDTASYEGSPSAVFVNLTRGTANGGHATGDRLESIENLTGSSHSDVLIGDDGANRLNGANGDDRLIGGDGDDVLVGGLGDDRLEGGEASDKLYGGGDNDVLIGGALGDLLNGQSGIDTAAYIGAVRGVTADLDNSRLRNTGDAAGDRYISIENLWGSNSNDSLHGDFRSNELRGLRGDDVLEGRGGNDTFVFSRNNGDDTIIDFEDGGGRDDVIDLSLVNTSFSQLDIRTDGANTVVDYGSGTITLQNFQASNLSAADFIF